MADQFPEIYMKPFLQLIQGSPATLTELVEDILSYFKTNFMPGEEVECKIAGVMYPARILLIAKAEESLLSTDDTVRPLNGTLYDVEFPENPEMPITTVAPSQIRRKQTLLSKPMLKQKIKQVALRDRYAGEPWAVDPALVTQYELPQPVPRKRTRTASMMLEGDEEEIYIRPVAKKPKYPMDDLELAKEAKEKGETLLPPPPPLSTDFGVPQDCVGDLFFILHFIVNFSKALQLTPCSLEDLCGALQHDAEIDITNEIHMRFLKLVLKERRNALSRRPLNADTWQDILRGYLEKRAKGEDDAVEAEKPDGENPNQEIKTENPDGGSGATTPIASSDTDGVSTSSDERHELEKMKKESGEGLHNLKEILEALKEADWQSLPVKQKVVILKFLSDAAVETECIRRTLDTYLETNKELSKEMREHDLLEKKRKLKEKEFEKEVKEKGSTVANGKNKEKEKAKDAEVKESALRQARREEQFDKHSVRLVALGQDRNYNRYWFWNYVPGRVFVESPESLKWGYYTTMAEIDALIQSLDERGIREKVLKGNLQRKYNKIHNSIDKRIHELQMEKFEVRRSTRRAAYSKSEKEKPYLTPELFLVEPVKLLQPALRVNRVCLIHQTKCGLAKNNTD